MIYQGCVPQNSVPRNPEGNNKGLLAHVQNPISPVVVGLQIINQAKHQAWALYTFLASPARISQKAPTTVAAPRGVFNVLEGICATCKWVCNHPMAPWLGLWWFQPTFPSVTKQKQKIHTFDHVWILETVYRSAQTKWEIWGTANSHQNQETYYSTGGDVRMPSYAYTEQRPAQDWMWS